MGITKSKSRNLPTLFSKLKIIHEVSKDLLFLKYYLPIYFLTSLLLSIIIVLCFGYGLYPMFVLFYLTTLLTAIGGTVLFSLCHSGYASTVLDNDKLQWIKYNFEKLLKDQEQQTYLILAIVFGIVSFLILSIGCCFRKVVKNISIYAREVSKATLFLLLNAIVPIISVFIQLAYLVLLVYVLL